MRRSATPVAGRSRSCRPRWPAATPRPGRDIYGQEQVRRQILELRAEIERGDSGGPLVLKDGTVGGIVYAEARTNPDVGYALSGTEVAAAIRPGIGRRAAVATGACLH